MYSDPVESRHVGHRRVNVPAVARHSPLHAAVGAALADTGLPENFALAVGIERIHDTRLLPGHYHVTSGARSDQHGSRTVIVVRAAVLGAIRPALPHDELYTSAGVVCCDQAMRPVFKFRATIASLVAVAGCDSCLRSSRTSRRDLDRRLEWTRCRRRTVRSCVPLFIALFVEADPPCKVCHARDPSRTRSAVTLPRNVQQGYCGSIARVSSHEAAGTNTRSPYAAARGRQARGLMVIDTRLPDLLTCARIERVDPPELIAEDEVATQSILDCERLQAHRTVRAIRPVQTAGGGVDRMNEAASATHEHRAVDDGRRRERGDVAVEAECPFEFEAAHVVQRSRPLLESGVRVRRRSSRSRCYARRRP